MHTEMERTGPLSMFRGVLGAAVASCGQAAPAGELSKVTGPRTPAAERV